MRLLKFAGLVAAGLAAGCAVVPPGVVVHPQPPVVVAPPPRHAVQIPPGHYPPPGSCRIWIPGVPPGQQSPPGPCAVLQHRVPPGGVLIGR